MAAGALTSLINAGTSAFGWYQYLNAQNTSLTLTIGTNKGKADLTFTSMEIPQEFGPLAGRHGCAKHEFPGGMIDLQPMGPFPGPVEWEGILIGSVNGASAFERALMMDNYRVQGTSVYLNYGGLWEWHGIFTEWTAKVKHQNYIIYRAVFMPDLDITEANNQQSLTVAQQLAQTPEGLFQQLKDYLNNAALNAGFSQATINSIGDFLSSVDSALLPAAGIISAVDPSALTGIQTTYATLISTLNPFEAADSGTNLNLVAPAVNVKNRATVMNNLLQGTIGNQNVTVRTVNANLPALAQQYYGDASKWTMIAKANGLVDPVQTGIQTLTIPNSTTV